MARAEIHIRTRSYSIACAPGQQDRLTALSARLDKRVDAISQAVGDVGEERLFLIAALSLLEELDSASAAPAPEPAVPSGDGEDGGRDDGRAISVLIDAAARIEAIAQRAEARGRTG